MRLEESRFCKIASGVLVLVLLGCGIVIYELRRFEGLLADDLCRVDVRRIVPAPDASSGLVTFEVDCGATTPVSTQINLVPNGASFSREAFPSFLSIKGRHDLVPRWFGAKAVEVAVPAIVGYYKKIDAVGGLRVRYHGEGAQRLSAILVMMMSTNLSADDVLRLLGLEPNATCGFVRETLRLGQAIAPGGLPAPFADGRPLGTALYFMVTPAAPVRLHRIRNDQLYHYYLGDPIEVLLLKVDGTSERVIVGPDLRAGHRVQLLIPGDTFHTARIIGARKFFLGASTEWPGVLPVDVELGDSETLAAQYPDVAEDIRGFPIPVAE